MARDVPLISINDQDIILVQFKHFWTSIQNEPKIDENSEKCWKQNLNLSQFFAILRPLKGYQTAFGECKMARDVPLVLRNDQNNILV